jgi:hypothetical protein
MAFEHSGLQSPYLTRSLASLSSSHILKNASGNLARKRGPERPRGRALPPIYRRPSREFEEQIRAGRIAALALADSTPLQGGVPIGVSGDTPQVDEAIALAGADALK